VAAPSIPNWQVQILHGLGAPVTQDNLTFLNAWTKAEGGSASNNPFNTTQQAPGASTYNSVGVRNYGSPQQGISATIQTLTNGRYGNILSALKQGTDARAAATALANSPWGTGSLVERMLGGPGGSVSAPVAPPTSYAGVPATAKPRVSQDVLNLFNQGNKLFGLGALPQSLASAPSPAAGQPGLSPPSRTAPANLSIPSVKGKKAINLAAHFLGVPYVWGGESPKGFDCSGLLQYVWKQQGVEIPRTTYDQFKTGTPVNANQLQPGDAVFFKGSDSKTVGGEVLPGHVAIYIGQGKVIQAPHTGSNVQITALTQIPGFMGARRYS
jgi:cell wall-associated NlpC family hydrolase